MTFKEIANNGTIRWLKFVGEIGLVIFAVAVAYTSLKFRVEVNSLINEKQDVKISLNTDSIAVIKSSVDKIGVRQEYVIKGIDEIKAELKK